MRGALLTAGRMAAAVLAVAAVGLFAAWAAGDLRQWHPAPEQPVPFSHAHHAGTLGLDCRFCHAAVEESSSAGFPAMEVCMGCHYPVPTRPQVEPVLWTRVAQVPEFVFFDHSVHVQAGVDCVTCHGAEGAAQDIVPTIPTPPSFYIERLRQQPPDYFVRVMTEGIGAMYPVAGRVPEAHRWAIAAWIKAQQDGE